MTFVRKLAAFSVLSATACAAIGATAAPALRDDNSRSEVEIRALMADARTASLSGDTQMISRLMTDDYVQTDIGGRVQDKATWLNEYFIPLARLIKSGQFKWDQYRRCDLRFRIGGPVAVVMGRLDAKGSGAKFDPQQHAWVAERGASFSGSLRFTHVYRQENGSWRLAALQNAVPVGPQPQSQTCD